MKTVFLIGFIFMNTLLSTVLFASEAQNTEAKVPGVGCKECGTSAAKLIPLDVEADAKELIAKLNSSFKCQKDSSVQDCLLIDWMKWKHQSYAPNCKGFFLDENGNLGSFSKLTAGLIAGDIKKFNQQSVFVKDNPDFDRLCPGFKSLTTTQKIAFHGWIFELLAFPESSCNIKVKPNLAAPTTKAVCMYQLEDRPEIRKWRSSGFDPQRCAVSASQILTAEGCTGCAFDEYKRKSIKSGTPFGIVDADGKYVSRAYWASMNPLSKSQEECLEKYYDSKTKKPIMLGNKPAFLSKCPKANNEWVPRYKFFRRVQRFPLCGTAYAGKELEELQNYQQKTKK